MADLTERKKLLSEIMAPVHLGDGAYVSHDGYQFWLGANHHTSKLVALDDHAMKALFEHWERHKELVEEIAKLSGTGGV